MHFNLCDVTFHYLLIIHQSILIPFVFLVQMIGNFQIGFCTHKMLFRPERPLFVQINFLFCVQKFPSKFSKMDFQTIPSKRTKHLSQRQQLARRHRSRLRYQKYQKSKEQTIGMSRFFTLRWSNLSPETSGCREPSDRL